jgi:protein-disulfide isomerase
MWLDSKGGKNLEPLFVDYFQTWISSPSVSFSNEGLIQGPENSKMTIIEFADFKCPHCKSAAPSLKAFTSSHPDVRFIFKVFPLDGACNANAQMPQGDGISCSLAKAVYCGEKLGKKGWELYENFFEEQENLRNPSTNSEYLSMILKKQQLVETDIQNCIKEEATHKVIINQSQEGVNAQIEGTPSIFVNGKKLKLGHTVTMLEKVYAYLNQ